MLQKLYTNFIMKTFILVLYLARYSSKAVPHVKLSHGICILHKRYVYVDMQLAIIIASYIHTAKMQIINMFKN